MRLPRFHQLSIFTQLSLLGALFLLISVFLTVDSAIQNQEPISKAATTTGITYVQSNLGSTDTNYVSVTFKQPVTDGNLIVVAISSYQGTLSISDSNNNSYKLAVLEPSTGNSQLAIYFANDVVGGQDTITVNSSANPYNTATSIAAHEYSGTALNNVLDKTHSATASVSANSVDVDSGNTELISQPDELVFGASSQGDNSSIDFTPGNDFTIRQSQPENVRYEAVFTEDKIVSASGSFNATFTSGNAIPWRAAVATFRSAGSDQISSQPTSTNTPVATISPVITPLPSVALQISSPVSTLTPSLIKPTEIIKDSNKPQVVNILNYNLLITCFSGQAFKGPCSEADFAKVDFNHDGIVNQLDYNFLLSELSKKGE